MCKRDKGQAQEPVLGIGTPILCGERRGQVLTIDKGTVEVLLDDRSRLLLPFSVIEKGMTKR